MSFSGHDGILEIDHCKFYECYTWNGRCNSCYARVGAEVERWNVVAWLWGFASDSRPMLSPVKVSSYEILPKSEGREIRIFDGTEDVTGRRLFVGWDARQELAVWWLTPEEFYYIEGTEIALPGYMDRQVMLIGQARATGRLWVDEEEFSEEEQEILAESAVTESFAGEDRPITGWLIENCHGIVVRRSDLGRLVSFPGLVTDLCRNRLESMRLRGGTR